MNRTELELRMESLKKQQELTSKAMKDTQTHRCYDEMHRDYGISLYSNLVYRL